MANNFRVGDQALYYGKGGEILKITILEQDARGSLEEYKLRVDDVVKPSMFPYLRVEEGYLFNSRKFNVDNGGNNWYLNRE